jgi:hypothetical protein
MKQDRDTGKARKYRDINQNNILCDAPDKQNSLPHPHTNPTAPHSHRPPPPPIMSAHPLLFFLLIPRTPSPPIHETLRFPQPHTVCILCQTASLPPPAP